MHEINTSSTPPNEVEAQKKRDKRNAELQGLFSHWTEEDFKAFDEAIAPFSEIDKEMWD